MALIRCSECGRNVSDKASACVHCGCPLTYGSKNQKYEMKAQKIDLKQKKQDLEDSKKTARCPRCGSTSLSAHKKGFGIGKAVIGASLTGGIGLVAGNLGAKKVRITCMNCGKQFMAGNKFWKISL
ncbi:MAG: hypothetical protein FWG72_08620 [Oscillospiraceae bacterium]|nr:hypothetical protein [Oscillospiraceae bacterium]